MYALEVTTGVHLIVITIGALGAYSVVDPEQVDTAPESVIKYNPALRAARQMRGRNQRSWKKKARKQRRNMYARYIQDVRNGDRLGGFPPITLWTMSEVEYKDGRLTIPYSATLCALDGETQLSAWFTLAEADPKWKDQPIAVVLYSGCAQNAADQMLHDFNHYATPVTETEMALHNHEGALTIAIKAGYEASGRNADLVVNKGSDAIGKHFTTEPRIIELAVGAAFGPDGFTLQTRGAAEKGNAQFYSLPTSSTVTAAVAAFLQREEGEARQVSKAGARAIGAYYHDHGRLPTRLSTKIDDDVAKSAIPQKAKQLHVVAKVIYRRLA
jgi:hypothetical protein